MMNSQSDAARSPPPGASPADPRDPRAESLFLPTAAQPAATWSLLGLPYDGGARRAGARLGPSAFRSALPTFTPFDGDRSLDAIHDLGDLDLPDNAAEAHARIEEAARNLSLENRKLICVGGDHGCTGSVVRGLARARPDLRLALISIDAHLDVREVDDPSVISSGTPLRRALDTTIAAGERTAIVGLRPFANAAYYWEWAQASGIRTATLDEVASRGAEAVMRELLEHVAKDADAVYLTVDLDAADVAYAPGVSAPGIGGLTSRELLALAGLVAADPRLLAADVMELAPPLDQDDRTARLATRVVLEILRGST